MYLYQNVSDVNINALLVKQIAHIVKLVMDYKEIVIQITACIL